MPNSSNISTFLKLKSYPLWPPPPKKKERALLLSELAFASGSFARNTVAS